MDRRKRGAAGPALEYLEAEIIRLTEQIEVEDDAKEKTKLRKKLDAINEKTKLRRTINAINPTE